MDLDFTGYVDDEQLLQYYQKAKVYVQFSKHEGFGASVVEAMLCECVPLVSNKGSLPEVVGGYGLVADSLSADVLSSLLKEPYVNGQKEWVKQKYSLDKRRQFLEELIKTQKEIIP